ncbi:MAG: leucine-rich repeat domain-containing protein [Pirellula sp.]
MKVPNSLVNLRNLAVSTRWSPSITQSCPVLIVSLVSALLCIANPKSVANEIAELPAAKELANWLEALPQSQNRDHAHFEFFQSLQSALKAPSDGRQRFVLPTSQTKAKRQSLVLKQAFSSDAERMQFESRVDALLTEIRAKAKAEDDSNRTEQSLRLKWLHAGLSPLANQLKLETWAPAQAILNPKRPGPNQNPNHPVTGWRGSSYEWTRTPHFDIASRGSKADAAMMAELCEQVYAVWQQIFYPYWANEYKQPGAPSSLANTPFQVVLFSGKREYEETLKRQVPNVELSTGYYNQNTRHSFFYFDQTKSYATLVHELTHQFFAEATSSNLEFDPDASPGFWVAEGVALYMESMSIREIGPAILVDVGGWDSPRLQSARFHFLRNETWLSIDSFGKLSGSGFRKADDIALRYSFAGGLVHRWMDSGDLSRNQMIQHLRYLYFQDVDSYLEPWNDKDLPRVYADYMQNGPRNASEYLPYINRPDLVLSRCGFDSERLIRLFSRRSKWNWVDLSFNAIDDTVIVNDQFRLDVVRLSLENTKVTNLSLDAISQMPKLEELDLSNCQITDLGLKNIAGNRSIRTIWLSGTKITDETLKILESCTRLEAVHVDRTEVTSEAWERFLKIKPRLRSTSTPP